MLNLTTSDARHAGLYAGQGRAIESRSPADRDEIVAVLPSSSDAEVDAAVAAADRGFPAWSAESPVARGRTLTRAAAILRERAEHIARLVTSEEGKPIGEARAEVANAADVLDYAGGLGTRLTGETLPSSRAGVSLSTVREPLGVVAAITPWNFPLNLPAVKLGSALVGGNTVVIKPASEAAASTLQLVGALHDAGVPEDALCVVLGDGSVVGRRLAGAPGIAALSFTGSTSVGREVEASAVAAGIRCQCEMGGNNALIVLQDADLEHAVTLAIEGAFRSSGQKCTATSRLIVERPVADHVRALLLERVALLRVGDPLDEQTFLGPLVSEAQIGSVLDDVAAAQEEGAQLLYGGSRLVARGLDRGYYMEPTVFGGVTAEMALARKEVFGPVVSIMEAEDAEHALELANATVYGLTASVCTNDLKEAQRFTRGLQTGAVSVNLPTAGLEFHAPFGGIKESGTAHKEQGSVSIEFFTRLKTVAVGLGRH